MSRGDFFKKNIKNLTVQKPVTGSVYHILYIYIERERERERESGGGPPGPKNAWDDFLSQSSPDDTHP